MNNTNGSTYHEWQSLRGDDQTYRKIGKGNINILTKFFSEKEVKTFIMMNTNVTMWLFYEFIIFYDNMATGTS